ncbi:hypothetical protein CYLTODRAFT_390831 [Cylindrobasidium torrendii FP15055 ss-10]|uniref:Integral membrane protein n=1 Tax=Cylindrobasidium torrendii FP15055 ss-10 TaxID=1314674 RepID=A0A0D7BNT0_9AGAR|nr:hypothetical protein CYLTODRAFT_390831 [Cylindrobasidium torrendii FP15055 ss-10]
MRKSTPLRCFSLLACAALYALPLVDASALANSSHSLSPRMDEHQHSGVVMEHWNETEQLKTHAATPPSYFTLDFDNVPETEHKHRGLMLMHAMFMGLAFFVSLPVGIAMRSVKHAWHGPVVASFYGFSMLGAAASASYTKSNPQLYEGQAHSSQGYFIIAIVAILTTIDLLFVFRRIYAFLRSKEKFEMHAFWNITILGHDETWLKSSLSAPEYVGLVSHEDALDDDAKDVSDIVYPTQYEHQGHFGKATWIRHVGNVLFAIVESALVVAGFSQVVLGVVVYTGGCRGNYTNGCLAHLIKGGIFWCYGLLSFSRYLGLGLFIPFSELGWAWNRTERDAPTAEFVESLVIFVYGITGVWMERFGAHTGDRFTTKQIEHIGIAAMFWFAGLVGMAIESKRIRRWMAPTAPTDSEEPHSYKASFNPFPALVIGVTGIAMAAHFQPFRFQVQIHMLWGNMLAAFAVLRCLTYFFLWLNPPRSHLPSRPPTEALASFFLCAGGFAFMLSTEEVTIAAMRRGRDDVMMFATVTVAVTCMAFCWLVGVVGFKGYLQTRVGSARVINASV